MRKVLALAALCAAAAAGCAGSRPVERVFAFVPVIYGHGDFEGAALLRVDPSTLQPLQRRGLRLGDAVTSSALSPDGRTLALGGENFGEILFVDLSRPNRVRHLTVVRAPGPDSGVEIEVESWPLRSRLLAVATVSGAWRAPHPSRLLVVDPRRQRVVRRTPLQGTVWSSVSTHDRTAALLVVRGRFPKLVVVRPDGTTWSRSLRRLDLGGRDGVRVGGNYYPPSREPALASDGRGRVFVVAPNRPIAEVLLRRREVRYHALALPRSYLSFPPPMTPGSGGIQLRFAASAVWLGHEQLAIGGFDELPSRTGHSFPERVLQVVDTRSWRRTRAIHVSSCHPLRGVMLCGASVGGFPPDGKGVRGPSLVAFDRRWHVLYEKRSPGLWWDVAAGRLFAGSADGKRVSELQPATGRLVRKIRPSLLSRDMWPLDLLAWAPPR